MYNVSFLKGVVIVFGWYILVIKHLYTKGFFNLKKILNFPQLTTCTKKSIQKKIKPNKTKNEK